MIYNFLHNLGLLNNRMERDFDDFQIECYKEEVAKNMDVLSKSIPDVELNIILSKGKYFIEPGVPLIRSWEILLWSGKAKNFKEHYIDG